MEFPDLGKQCSEASCKKLDFLPVRCDACQKIFCHDHMTYASHSCDSAYKKDVQVPVCPLCNIPIPVVRGQPPDIAVSAHIDTQCMSDPAKDRRKVYINKCSLKGCKAKELIPVVCKECRLNFCLKHRHGSDHNCIGRAAAQRQNVVTAALARQQKNSSPLNSNSRIGVQNASTAAVQGDLSEDEALARALQLSMEEANFATTNHNMAWTATDNHRRRMQDRCSLS